MIPLLAAIYSAPLGGNQDPVFLVGPTGTCKTELAALAQQHFGPDFVARNLPGSWSSTANFLEELAFQAKDILLVIDDFVPGTATDGAAAHRMADRVLRAAGNGAGRGRLNADSSQRQAHPPRATILSTGEDVPLGQSLRARNAIVSLALGDVRLDQLTLAQQAGRTGVFAEAMAAYVLWLAADLRGHREAFEAERLRLRGHIAGMGQRHRRTPDVVARLVAGIDSLLRFCAEGGVLGEQAIGEFRARSLAALLDVAQAQETELADSDPVDFFLKTLASALSSGKAHLEAVSGGAPCAEAIWGWRPGTATAVGVPTSYVPQGACIGWLDGDKVCLNPRAAYDIVVKAALSSSVTLPSLAMLKKRLHQRQLLLSVGSRGGQQRYTERKVIRGQRVEVMVVHQDSLYPENVAQVAHSTELLANEGIASGPLLNPTEPVGQEVAHFVAHAEARAEAQPGGTHPLGRRDARVAAHEHAVRQARELDPQELEERLAIENEGQGDDL